MDSKQISSKVSIIVPTLNRSGFLPNAIKSITQQNYQNVEIIVIDDGSTDDTASVMERMIQQYPFLKYYSNECEKGPAGARNTGFRKATGDFLAFLDSDDVWLENHLKPGMVILRQYPEIDVLFGNFKIYDYHSNKQISEFFKEKRQLFKLKGEKINNDLVILRDDLFKTLIQDNFFHLGSVIIRMKNMEGIQFNEKIFFAEDRDFAIRLFKEKQATFAYRREPLFILYKHGSNLSADDLNSHYLFLKSHQVLFEEYLEKYYLNNQEKSILKKRIRNSTIGLAYNFRKRKKFKKSFSAIFSGMKYGFCFKQMIELAKVIYASTLGILHLEFSQLEVPTSI